MVASEIPSSISLCVKSFLRSTISSCTTEIRAINPPNAVLPILRKLRNRNHKGGLRIKGESLFFCPELISPWTVCVKVPVAGWRSVLQSQLSDLLALLSSPSIYGAALILGRFQVAKPFGQIDECLRWRFFETGNVYFFQDGGPAFGRFERHERGAKLLDAGRRNLWRRNYRRVGHFRAARYHAASVLLPGTADARKRGDDAHIEKATFHRPTDGGLIIHAAYPLIGHGNLVVPHHCIRDPPHICVAIGHDNALSLDIGDTRERGILFHNE